MEDYFEIEAEGTIQTAADYEYNTLMRLLKVSVSKHLIDEHYTVIWANDFYYELIGWSREEYEITFHNRCDDYYRYSDDSNEWERIVATVKSALETNQSGYTMISPIRRKNGERIWVNFSTAFSQEYVNGCQVAYTVLTSINDLVRIQTEQAVTYDNLPGFIAKFRLDGSQLYLVDSNERFQDFFGNGAGDSLSCGFSNYDTESNQNAFLQNLPRMKKGEHLHFTVQAKASDGSNVWLQINADCIDWINQSPIYLVVYIDITDITEQRELQRQLEERSAMLNEALDEAKKANQAKSDFLSRMSHDIRTPMNAIMGMVSIAASHVDDQERVLDCLNKIDVSSKLLLSLINEVLDMSKIESGRITMEEDNFRLGEVIQNIITIIHPSILEKHHTFDIHTHSVRHELVTGDPKRIEQIFLNILSNAVKYTPDHGKIILEIEELPSEREGYGYYRFIFRDNGYGMKPQFLSKIFLPFERADDTSVHMIQGTGLGMAISQNIIHMMGGDITVESEYGKGSTFVVTLYLKLQNKQIPELVLPSGLSVLVADDDQITCETTCQMLDDIGLAGQWVSSGKEAVAKAVEAHKRRADYFAIILDMRMPEINGIEAARQIREAIGENVPVILLSAYDYTEYETEARIAGVNGFIVKPMLKSSLICALKRYALKEPGPSVSDIPPKPARSYEGKHLLLAEDNDLNREIAVEVLTGTGASVDTAVNGLEAVQKFESSPAGYYSMIFMDLQMPVMNGLEATASIRSLDRKDSKTIPIAAMTANVFSEDIAESRAAGMNAHLAKPLSPDMIYQTMEELIPVFSI